MRPGREAGPEAGPSLAVIVPVLNEADRIYRVVDHLAAQDADERIIVDGGSDDGTWEALSGQLPSGTGIKVFQRPRGRAKQMNYGASRTRSDVLLFLHADTQLPSAARDRVCQAILGGARWGRFDVALDSRRPLLRCVAWAMNQRSALTGICTGDQAIFVYRELFSELGGYADIPLMEDIELSRRLKKKAAPWRVRDRSLTSARRWERDGALRTIGMMWLLRLAYWGGVDPARLARGYRDAR